MAPRTKRRDQWRLAKNGTWTISLGSRGQRVRLFQMTKDGAFYREVRHPGGNKDRRTLSTRDKAEAERLGRLLLAAIITGTAPRAREVVRLGALADAFVAESPKFLDNAPHTKADQRTRLQILRAAIGDARDAGTLTEHDIDQFQARRRAGGIKYGDGKVTGRVRQRSVQADVKLLKQALRWATTRTMPDGRRWLDQNPLQHLTVKGERDVQRPVADYDRYEATIKAMRDLQEKYAEEAGTTASPKAARRAEVRRMAWVRAELALWLLEATGRRRGAVAGLRWADVDFSGQRITWHEEFDKAGRTTTVPYADAFFGTLREFQRRLGALGGYIFARQDDPESPTKPELLYQWIMKAEAHAGLPKLKLGGTHPLRRKYVSERRHLPIKLVLAAIGSTDAATLLKCYDQPDDAELLEVTGLTLKRVAAARTSREATSA